MLARLEESVALAAAERARVEQAAPAASRSCARPASALRDLGRELDELVSSVHRDEMARTQQRMRIEQLEERALDELGLDLETLVADYGPDQLVAVHRRGRPRASEAPDAGALTTARSRPSGCARRSGRWPSWAGSTRSRWRSSPRSRSGTSSSPSSSRTSSNTRRDLLDIVREVDERVEQVFTEAYADVSEAFDATFARLFPGGEGRLVLTDPDDMLNTGIEVEARPPGKKIKRLSLLSGGERSLVAVAFLVALFKARPSPFYILDEVEAALDDTNLGRLLQIYEELRENSQLLVITHQKRTMEVGDALYGVSMRGDGVSAVISQRLREQEPA